VLTLRFPSQLKTSSATIDEDSQRLGVRDSSWTSFDGATNMPDEEWVKKLEDGRKVKFIYQELPEDGAFITAQIERNEVVYSVVLTKAGNPLSREDVESHFKGELSKK
jgi:hypothetical protein